MLNLRPLYRHRFTYPKGWSVTLDGVNGTQAQHFYLAEGTCEGLISGRLHGANHPAQRTDLTMTADFQGVIETDDGATLFCNVHGYGRNHPSGRRHVVVVATHLTADERYSWINNVLCVGLGHVNTHASDRFQETPESAVKPDVEYWIDWYELDWDPSDAMPLPTQKFRVKR